jgi:predicted ribosomally synthesized peptide with SipW-like signal peptide
MTKRLPLAFLAILLIVLLAGLGVAYGLWSETLTIEGTVNTGNVDVQFANVSITEKVVDYFSDGPYGMEKPEPHEKANAANCYFRIDNVGTDNETLVVWTEGAYPSWRCYVDFSVKSIGSVPVHVFPPVRINVPNMNNNLPEAFWCEFPPNKNYKQLHLNDTLTCHIKIHFHNDEGIQENSTYNFKYTITAKQWNE